MHISAIIDAYLYFLHARVVCSWCSTLICIPQRRLRYCVLTDMVHVIWCIVMYCCTRKIWSLGSSRAKQRGCVLNTCVIIPDALLWRLVSAWAANGMGLSHDQRNWQYIHFSCVDIVIFSSAVYISWLQRVTYSVSCRTRPHYIVFVTLSTTDATRYAYWCCKLPNSSFQHVNSILTASSTLGCIFSGSMCSAGALSSAVRGCCYLAHRAAVEFTGDGALFLFYFSSDWNRSDTKL